MAGCVLEEIVKDSSSINNTALLPERSQSRSIIKTITNHQANQVVAHFAPLGALSAAQHSMFQRLSAVASTLVTQIVDVYFRKNLVQKKKKSRLHQNIS